MIYYCFGSKDDLFATCLRTAYAHIREFEQSLHMDDLSPKDAIEAYVRGTINYHEAHPELALLVRGENLLGAVHLAREDDLRNRQIIDLLDGVLARGVASGEFRSDARGIELHLMVTALGNFRITNQSTFEVLFGHVTRDPARLDHDIEQYVQMVLGWLTSGTSA